MRETVWILPGVRVKELWKPHPCTRGPDVYNHWYSNCFARSIVTKLRCETIRTESISSSNLFPRQILFLFVKDDHVNSRAVFAMEMVLHARTNLFLFVFVGRTVIKSYTQHNTHTRSVYKNITQTLDNDKKSKQMV